ncbi:MAG TPA: RsmE family RNA methyltransferase [Candidatus Absconditabacterales bacterium]|nr:RsmE family RNA methyltransferase [Candidatus Absconditabacterales bacterium]
MQLFITEFTKTGNQININNKEILDQMRKVLRMKIGDKFFVQNKDERLEIKILDRDKTTITGNILKTKTNPLGNINSELGIIVSMSNRWSKMELIIQKLSEIGIKNIYIRPSERSIIKDSNEKKMKRINKISKEAVEQSRGRELPKIKFIKDISKIIQDKKVIIFDKNQRCNVASIQRGNAIGIIGPEGGLTEKDYKKFGKNYETISLGDTVLRTETASIVAGRILKNLK